MQSKQSRSDQSPGTCVSLIVGLLGGKHPGEPLPCIQVNCPAPVVEGSLLVVVNFVAHLLAVVILVVVA